MTQKKCLIGLNRGPWLPDEDLVLRAYIEANGIGRWSTLPTKAGLKRCGKSCRLRWLNYLRPNLKRGHISPDEEELIIRLHKLLGNRWSLIAARVPGRTDNDIKNFWNIHLSKKLGCKDIDLNRTPYSKLSKAKDSSDNKVQCSGRGDWTKGKMASESSNDMSLHTGNLNAKTDSITAPTEYKQLEHPCNGEPELNPFSQESNKLSDAAVLQHVTPTDVYSSFDTACKTRIDSDSLWFECLPWLGSNEDHKLYCDNVFQSTSFYTGVQPYNIVSEFDIKELWE